jgi:gliding motility-associated-like protein
MKTFLTLSIPFLISCSLMAQINPPSLTCATTLFNGDVEIAWEIPTNTCGTTFNGYRIYVSSDPSQPFSLLTIVTDPNETTFIHTGANGNNLTWHYYMTTDLICPNEVPGQSMVLSNEVPNVTEMDYVTVNAAGNVEIHWIANTSLETRSYAIFWETPSGFVSIDTVYGRTTTSYEHIGSSPSTTQETYTIIAMDACGNTGLVNNDPQSTILLNTSIDRCTREITLNWTPYQNWTTGVLAHQIWVTKDGGSPQFFKYIGDTTQFLYQYADDGEQLSFQVYAVRRGSSTRSGSNFVNMNIDVVAPMDFIYLKNITVDADNKVQVEWRWDASADISNYTINRAGLDLGFSGIDSTSAVFPLDEYNSYLDTSANAGEQMLAYSVSSNDSCDNKIISNFGTTILLEGIPLSNFTNNFTWSPLQINNARIQDYTIYKIIDGVETPIETLDFFITDYEDGLDGYNEDDARRCYFVIARAEMEYPDGLVETIYSRSNTLCLSQPAKLHVPNAFAPSGENTHFKPLVVFGETATFKMAIYNRWGQMIFETTDVERGWDGRASNGKAVRQGLYVYQMSITKTDGTVTEKQGTVMLIR